MDLFGFSGDPPILLIGANVRFLAENAVRHGHNIFAIDYYGDWDLQKICPTRSAKRDGDGSFDLESLLDMADGIENRGVVYCAGFENEVSSIARLKKLGNVFGCSLEAVRKSRDPEFLTSISRSWDINYPTFRYASDDTMKNSRWLQKPILGMGGVNIRFADGGEARDADGFYYQKYISGIPSSATFVSNGVEATLLGVSTQILGEESFGSSGFRYVGNVFPHPFTAEVRDKVVSMGEALTLELNLKGLWGYDFIYDGEVWLIEINPRPTAALGGLAIATWNDYLSLHIASSLDEEKNLIIDPGPIGQYTAQARVFAKEECLFHNPEKWFERGARDIPHAGEYIAACDPVLTITVTDGSYNSALGRLREEARELEADLSLRAHRIGDTI